MLLPGLKHRHSIVVLIVIGVVAYGSSLFTPSLFGDDWWYRIEGCVNGTLQCPQWDQTRPLVFCWPSLLCKLYGLSVVADHAVSVAVSILLAVFVYALFVRLVPQDHLFCLIVSSIFLVYPAVYVRTWITGSNLQMGLGLFLASFYLLADFWRDGGWWAWLTSVVLFLLSLGIYESQIGLAVAGSLGLFAVAKSHPPARRLALLAPVLLAVFFVAWRIWGQEAAGIDGGYGTELISLSPTLLLSRLVLGFRIVLQWSWTGAVSQLLRSVKTLNPIDPLTGVPILAGMLVLVVLAAVLLRRSVGLVSGNPDERISGHRSTVRRFLALGLGGLVGVGLGFIPVIAVSSPGQGFAPSRHSILPSIGAAVLLGAVLALASMLIRPRQRSASLVLVLLALPFLAVGIAMQIKQHRDTARSWQEQTAIWNQLFELAPNLADGTGVYFVMPAHSESWAPRPLEDGYWGAGTSAALSMFYGNESLHGYFIYDDLPSPQFIEEGVTRPWGVVPYDQMVMFRYERDAERLTLLQQVNRDLLDGITPTEGLGLDRILITPVVSSELRCLVEPDTRHSKDE